MKLKNTIEEIEKVKTLLESKDKFQYLLGCELLKTFCKFHEGGLVIGNAYSVMFHRRDYSMESFGMDYTIRIKTHPVYFPGFTICPKYHDKIIKTASHLQSIEIRKNQILLMEPI